MLNLERKSLRTKFLFQDIIVFKGIKCLNMLILGSTGTDFKPAGLFQNTHTDTSRLATQDSGAKNGIIKVKGKIPATRSQFL